MGIADGARREREKWEWLGPKFYVSMTATPLPYGGHDLVGYLALIE